MKPHAIVPMVFLSLLLSVNNAVASNKHPLEGCYSLVSRDGKELSVLVVLNVRGKMYLAPVKPVLVSGMIWSASYTNLLKELDQATDSELEESQAQDVTKEQYIDYFGLKADEMENIEFGMMHSQQAGPTMALFKIKRGKRVAELGQMFVDPDNKAPVKPTDYFAILLYVRAWVNKIECP